MTCANLYFRKDGFDILINPSAGLRTAVQTTITVRVYNPETYDAGGTVKLYWAGVTNTNNYDFPPTALSVTGEANPVAPAKTIPAGGHADFTYIWAPDSTVAPDGSNFNHLALFAQADATQMIGGPGACGGVTHDGDWVLSKVYNVAQIFRYAFVPLGAAPAQHLAAAPPQHHEIFSDHEPRPVTTTSSGSVLRMQPIHWRPSKPDHAPAAPLGAKSQP